MKPSGGDPGPTVFVLFGATGDLAKRLVLPAFYRLAMEGLLPRDWLLVGNGRGNVAHEDFRKHVHDVLTEFGPHPKDGPWQEFAGRLRFAGGGFASEDPGSLLGVLDEARSALGGRPQLIHYFAVPPVAFTGLTKALGQHGLAKGARVVYEKPFGTSADSRKGRQLAADPRAAVVLYWRELLQQVRVTGRVERLGDEESDDLFARRTREAQAATMVSEQDAPLDDLDLLRAAARDILSADGAIGRPEHWYAYRVVPELVEFWHGSPDRLHRRLRYVRVDGGAWTVSRVQP